MKFDFDVRWLIADSDQELDTRLLLLLVKINQAGSLQLAAKEIGVSYRTAWELIHSWNNAFDTPLCIMERGRGTKLTALGQKLIQTKFSIEKEHIDTLHAAANKLNNEINALIGQRHKKKKVTFSASHDLAINFLQSILELSGKHEIEFHSRGSLENLKLLNSCQVDIAGFHFPEGELVNIMAPKFSQWLNDEEHTLIQLATREQGLIIKPSLKKHVTSLKSLTRHSIKFVNRQSGSGTRTIFDEMIKLNGINKKNITGYKKEEFTHTAVAAMISSGHADVGFGLKAAANQFKLSFLPLVTESYVIAMHNSLARDIRDEIRSALKDKKLKNKIRKLPGYNTERTGKIIHANKLFSKDQET